MQKHTGIALRPVDLRLVIKAVLRNEVVHTFDDPFSRELVQAASILAPRSGFCIWLVTCTICIRDCALSWANV